MITSYGSLDDVQLDIVDSTDPSSGEGEDDNEEIEESDMQAIMRFASSFDGNISKHGPKSHRATAKEISQLAKSFSMEIQDHDHADEDRIQNALREAGSFSFGIVAVELRIYDEEKGNLYRPNGGWWRSPLFPTSEALKRLEDPSNPNYLPPSPIIPGEGLVGNLWYNSRDYPMGAATIEMVGEKSKEHQETRQERYVSRRRMALTAVDPAKSQPERRSWFQMLPATKRPTVKATEHQRKSIFQHISSFTAPTRSTERNLHWQDVHSLAVDPFQPVQPRLHLFDEAGIGLAAGIKVSFEGHRGIVIYYSRRTADRSLLAEAANEEFLRRSASHIVSASALMEARRANMVLKKQRIKERMTRVRAKLRAVHAFRTRNHMKGCPKRKVRIKRNVEPLSTSLSHSAVQALNKWMIDEGDIIRRRGRRFAKKCQGGNLQHPPGAPLTQVLWNFAGCFITLLIVISTSNSISRSTNGQHGIMIAPFAAFVTLQYSLTAAPPSQPREAFYGNIMAGLVGLFLKYIPASVFPALFRLSLAPSVTIALMARLGLNHPPAAANALFFATKDGTWWSFLLVLFATAESVIIATVINNLNDQKQYPTYWSLGIVSLKKSLLSA